MSIQKRPKGILKPPSSFPSHADAPLESAQLPPFVPPPAPRVQPSSSITASAGFDAPRTITPEQHERNRELAIRHATVLQQRKDAEARTLDNIEELMDFPTIFPPAATAARPANVDARRFQTLIAPLNTSDYDELLTERNCADRCAYVFCPVVLRRDRSARANVNRLRYDGSKFHTVKQAMLERWCSSECARRALYIRVQLTETPAWERAGGQVRDVELLHEGDDLVLEEKMRSLQVGGLSHEDDMAVEDNQAHDEALLQTAMEQLALERGDTKTESSRRSVVLPSSIVERPHMGGQPPGNIRPPTLDAGGDGAIEGYAPRTMPPSSNGILHDPGRRRTDDQDDDDDSNDDDNDNDTHGDWLN